MNMKRRLATLEGERQYDGIGAMLDALDDPVAMAKLRISPSLAALLDSLDPAVPHGDDVGRPAVTRNQDLPL